MNNNIVAQMRPLTQDERMSATEHARKAAIRSIGECPQRKDFAHRTVSKFPPIFTLLIIGLCLIALAAAFAPSAIRLYHIGSQTFGESIDHLPSVQIAGLATVIMAEVSQLVFSLALASLGTSKTSRLLLIGGILISTSLALVVSLNRI